jgi:hypothetical protein
MSTQQFANWRLVQAGSNRWTIWDEDKPAQFRSDDSEQAFRKFIKMLLVAVETYFPDEVRRELDALLRCGDRVSAWRRVRLLFDYDSSDVMWARARFPPMPESTFCIYDKDGVKVYEHTSYDTASSSQQSGLCSDVRMIICLDAIVIDSAGRWRIESRARSSQPSAQRVTLLSSTA